MYYTEGQEAYHNGIDVFDNPYLHSRNSSKAVLWENGWYDEAENDIDDEES